MGALALGSPSRAALILPVTARAIARSRRNTLRRIQKTSLNRVTITQTRSLPSFIGLADPSP